MAFCVPNGTCIAIIGILPHCGIRLNMSITNSYRSECIGDNIYGTLNEGLINRHSPFLLYVTFMFKRLAVVFEISKFSSQLEANSSPCDICLDGQGEILLHSRALYLPTRYVRLCPFEYFIRSANLSVFSIT